MQIELGPLFKDPVSRNITIKITDPMNAIDIRMPRSDARIQVAINENKLYFYVSNDVEERMYEMIRNEQGGFELINTEI